MLTNIEAMSDDFSPIFFSRKVSSRPHKQLSTENMLWLMTGKKCLLIRLLGFSGDKLYI